MDRLLEKLDRKMIIDPGKHDVNNIYKLMTGIIVPRPIAFVTSMDPAGVLNLAPFSFFTAVSANPPVICFSPLIRGKDASKKDTLKNIEATKEFVVNVVSEDFASRMNICSFDFPPEVDEFKESGLTPLASDLVHPPRVKESRVSMECTLVQIVHVSQRPLGGSIVLGEVVRFHVEDELFKDYRINPDVLRAIGRMGGPTYTRTTDRFEMPRPDSRDFKH